MENQGYVQMFENFLDFFWDELTCKENALDFGSGPTPVLSEVLKKRHINVDCYDKFYQPAEIFQHKTYDLITSTEVFEHLEAPLETLTDLSTHVKSGGIVALMTLFHANDHRQFLEWWYKRDKTHITFFTPKTIRVMAEKSGFDVIKEDGRRIAVLKKR
jgi:2-polyprenyl-3-methyl-5-hydroxy-6-metoxy-1,4-benzoquinol methylase